MSESCPHAGASLATGACNIKGIIVCPLHGYKFDITKGKSADGHEYIFRRYILKYSGSMYFFEQ
jgi:3-phenylpropionate/trans-cinnamate dioxygenase ferredoxin subunit